MNRFLTSLLLAIALWSPSAIHAAGPAHPPPGVDAYSGGPIAIDPVHHRIFFCDWANNRVLVYQNENGVLGAAPLAILGQPNRQASAMNGTGEANANPCGLAFPNGLVYDAKRDGLWVSDFINNRVVYFDTRELKSFQPASFAIGQPGLGQNESGTDERSLRGPTGLALSLDGALLYVADSFNHRVLVFPVDVLANRPYACAVIGQPGFSTATAGTSATSLRAPSGLALDADSQVYIADTGNNRVVVFDGNAALTGASAFLVLGQKDFQSAVAASGPDGLRAPTAITINELDSWVFLADSGNHRVLGYYGRGANPLRAAAVIGQPDIDSHLAQPAAIGLDNPVGLEFSPVDRRLWVSESGNARVGFYKLSE